MNLNLSRRLTAAALPATLLGIERLLLSRGFRAVTRSEMVDGRRFWRWDRDRQWAIDRVDASYRVHSPHDLSVGVIAQLRLDAQRELTMDGAIPHFLAGRLLMSEVPFLQWLRLRTPERLAEHFVAEVERALPWFEQYATPEKCLERLRSPERNGVGIGKPPHQRALAVLEALRQ